MRNLDPALVARRGLSAFFYQLIATDVGLKFNLSADGVHVSLKS